MKLFFSAKETALLKRQLKKLKLSNLIFCSFENRFARSGGLASVTTNILPFLKDINNIPNVVLFTPCYPEIINISKLKSTSIKFSVPFANKNVLVEIYEYSWKYSEPDKGSVKEYYLKAKGFFNTSKNIKDPYTYHEKDKRKNNDTLNYNAMFFCKTVPFAAKALGIEENIVFHLNEWQTSLISLTSKEAILNGTLRSCGTIQTIHNSYDSTISQENLEALLDKPRRQKLKNTTRKGLSAYQIGLQLVDAPVTTVSDNFANELTTDIIQTKHYAPHLQDILKTSAPYGVNNGMFVRFSPDFPKRENHSIDEVRTIKLRKRKALLEILNSYTPRKRFGKLTYKGKTILKLPDDIPIIAMSGRLDPLQKGYFVLLRAIEKFTRDKIKVILTPLPVKKSDLDYFYEIVGKCEGDVTVFPFRMEKGYHEIQTGSTFGIMPSIYEPFGAAVEYMASGTINIGRATGGLVDQIDSNSGFLFKEDAVFHTVRNVKAFIETGHMIQARKTNPWMLSMADNLYDVMGKAIDLYQRKPDKYYQLIINGFKKARRFSWVSNAKKYHDVYKMINKT
jgi:glycogen synthase